MTDQPANFVAVIPDMLNVHVAHLRYQGFGASLSACLTPNIFLESLSDRS
jgi:hypothetical protein